MPHRYIQQLVWFASVVLLQTTTVHLKMCCKFQVSGLSAAVLCMKTCGASKHMPLTQLACLLSALCLRQLLNYVQHRQSNGLIFTSACLQNGGAWCRIKFWAALLQRRTGMFINHTPMQHLSWLLVKNLYEFSPDLGSSGTAKTARH